MRRNFKFALEECDRLYKIEIHYLYIQDQTYKNIDELLKTKVLGKSYDESLAVLANGVLDSIEVQSITSKLQFNDKNDGLKGDKYIKCSDKFV